MADTPQILRWNNQTQNPSGADEQAFLAQLRPYDPNAGYVYDPHLYQTGEDTYAGGYRLNVDYSKLPATGLKPGASSLNDELVYDNVTPSINFTGRDQAYDVVDPSKQVHSSVYGDIMPVGNQSYRDTSMDRLFNILGPALVGGFAFAAPSIAGAMSGGALGGAGSAGAASGGLLDTAGADPWDLMGDPSAYGLGGSAPVDASGFGMNDRSLGLSNGGESGYGMYDRSLGLSDGSSLDTGTLGSQAAAPISEQGTPARVGDVLRNGGVPGLDNIAQSLRELGIDPAKLAQIGSGLAGGAPGGGGGFGGGGGGGGMGGGGEDAVAIIRRFYGQDALSKLKGQAHG